MSEQRTGKRRVGLRSSGGGAAGRRRYKLIADLLSAKHDLVALGQMHRMSPEKLSAWVGDAENQKTLGGLCVLADLQTQLLLSRYRLLAASRLIKLATTETGEGAEVARKACVDLLKMDLKRADLEGLKALAGEAGEVLEGDEEGELAGLRELLYGPRKVTPDAPESPDARK